MKTFTLLQINRENVVDADGEEACIKAISKGRIGAAINMRLFEAVALIEARNPEDAFDIDCNPSRYEERQSLVVNMVVRQGMKVGDVLIDNKTGQFYICKPAEWGMCGAFEYAMPQIAGRQPQLLRHKLIDDEAFS